MSTRETISDLYVSTLGKDTWTGLLPKPNAGKTDGPLASITRARDILSDRKRRGLLEGPVTVWIRAGRYPIDAPIEFGPEDSAPVTYAAYPGEAPVIDGGVPITGWRVVTLDSGIRAWEADANVLIKKHGYFTSLFVNGRRAPRTRLPREGYYHIEDVPQEFVEHHDRMHNGSFDGTRHFRFAKGDIRNFRNVTDVDIIALHIWLEERMPIDWVDESSCLVKSTRKSSAGLHKGVRYYLENVREALETPGQWYLDRSTGKILYIPRKGEVMGKTEVCAPRLLQFVRIFGDPRSQRDVSFLKFQGLTFEHSAWVQPRGFGKRFDPCAPEDQWLVQHSAKHALRFTVPGIDYAAGGLQASYTVPGAIYLQSAKNCAIEDCTIRHCGWFGIELADGCCGNRIVGNTVTDLGAGGLKLDGADTDGAVSCRTGNNTITDNSISDGGHVFPSASGILIVHAHNNLIAHNHVHDFFYSGISCGWVWGFGDNPSYGNRIEKNHIHDLGKGVLSDMGGIYLLGVQPGTTVIGNVIHDIEKSEYGGWGIYTDEGSSHIVIEDNVVYRVNSQPYFQHFGRENIVRNNIFAFGKEGVIGVGRGPSFRWMEKCAHGDGGIRRSFTLERNILITDNAPVIVFGVVDETAAIAAKPIDSDLNVIWDVSGKNPCFHSRTKDPKRPRRMSLAQVRKAGCDLHSLVADPRCRNPRQGSFAIPRSSPALRLGFRPIASTDVGPRVKR